MTSYQDLLRTPTVYDLFFVPYAEKDAAKRMGAKWAPYMKVWYAPTAKVANNMATRWDKFDIDNPLTEIIGEDRTFGGDELFVDLIPRSCWFKNARTNISGVDWKRVRDLVVKRVQSRCECCGGHGVDVHERWEYDNEHHCQILRRLVLLCKACHESTHMGFAGISGRRDEAMQHLRTVRGISHQEADAHCCTAFDTWHERNNIEWTLDISILTTSGISVIESNTT